MNRIDRLFVIALIFQTQKRLRACDLATSFEVSERTIFRDITALSESGIPIVALPGKEYELTQGFHLPLVVLSRLRESA